MLTRSSPACAQLVGEQPERGAVGRDRQVGLAPAAGESAWPGPAARPAWPTSTGRWARTVGSPPVRRMPSTSKRSTKIRASRSISSKVSSSLAGQPLHALRRHAVRAAEVAAVGDRDAQVADGAPERVDEVRRGACYGSAWAADATAPRSVSASRRTSTSPPGGDAVAVGEHGEAVGGRGGRQLVAALGAGRADVEAAVGAERAVHPRRSASCRRAGGAAPSSATATHRRAGRGRGGPSSGAAPGGRTARSCTSDDTGLPGRPNTRHLGARRALSRPKANGLAGLMAICIQCMSADAVEHDLDDVEVAHAHAAAGDDGVARGRRACDGGGRGRPRRRGPGRGRPARAPAWATSAEQHRLVALADLAGRERARRPRPARRRSTARRPAAGGRTAHAPGRRCWPARRGGPGAATVPAGEHDVARRDVVAGAAHRVAGGRPRRSMRTRRPPSSVSVSSTITTASAPCGQRRAGHDPDRLARRRPAPSGAAPAASVADHPQLDRGAAVSAACTA